MIAELNFWNEFSFRFVKPTPAEGIRNCPDFVFAVNIASATGST